MALSDMYEDQQLYLKTIFAYFREHAKWPPHRYLEQWFFQYYSTLDIEEIVQSLPAEFTSPINFNALTDSKATLNIFSIYQNWGQVEELATFLHVLELCVDTYYRTFDGKLIISNTVIAQYYPLWHAMAIKKVGLLLEQEKDIWSIFTSPDSE